tara:strand:- start:329 stop:655 length:327 start_codon:yes stop_codon:yes gene_type:complete
MPGKHKKQYLKKTGREGTFDYTQSKKDIKKKYKTDKETKSKVLNSNVVNFVKNRVGKISAGMFKHAQHDQRLQIMSKPVVKGIYNLPIDSTLQKKGRPNMLNKCGSHR